MHVAPIVPISAFLRNTELLERSDTAVVFCYEGERTQSVRAVLLCTTARRVLLIVGAEGGFSPAEAEAIRAAGAQTVSLGRLILRAETAAVTALAVTQYELGNLSVLP